MVETKLRDRFDKRDRHLRFSLRIETLPTF
jgi:hypothetical protein